MRNYLFDRTVVTIAEQKARKRKKRRWMWGIPLFLAAVGIGVAGALYFAPKIWAPPPGDTGATEPDPGYAEDETRGETTIPRAPVGDGTTLILCTEEREVLSSNELYEKALPSVVSVQARIGDRIAAGSGVIMSENGYVLTNYHIVEGGSEAWVFLLTDGAGFEAELVGYAPELDLAVLKIEGEGLAAAEFGDSRDLIVGDNVFALGNPLGYLYGSLTEGIVSAPVRSVELDGREMELIQTSAALNLGNSGGALLNQRGQVVGITTAKLTGRKNNTSIEGLGLALPISEIRNQINSIIQNGRVITPRIGIMCLAAEVDGVEGIFVDSVIDGDPAQLAGVHPMDFITHVNGVPVTVLEELKDVLYATGVGGEVVLSIRRGTELLEIPVVLVE